jgi:hypothetical protein
MSDDEKHSSLELETELLYDDDTCDDKDILLGDSHVRGSGMVGSVSNLVNTIIGSGILALPSSAAGVGWALAVAMMAVSALLTLWSLVYLSKCAGKMGGDKTSFGKSHWALTENIIRCEKPIATVAPLPVIKSLRGPSHAIGAAAARTYPWMIMVADFFVFATLFGICVAYATIPGGYATVHTCRPDHMSLCVHHPSDRTPL